MIHNQEKSAIRNSIEIKEMVELADNHIAKANIYKYYVILENKWKCDYNEERNERYKNIQLEIL